MPLVEGDFEQKQEEEDEEHSLEARWVVARPIGEVTCLFSDVGGNVRHVLPYR